MNNITTRHVETDWFRIDKANGSASPCDAVRVLRAACSVYLRRHAADAVASGRFQTSFAIYSQWRHLTTDEQADL